MSFTRKEQRLLHDAYFKVIQENEQFIEVMSRNTNHCWNIFKNCIESRLVVTLYHKHKQADRYYHKHRTFRSVTDAIEEIKTHDAYVLEQQRIQTENPSVTDIRELKVREQSGYKYQPTPTIILKGNWLEQCGFSIGSPIQVACENGKLTITAVQ